MVSMRTPSSQQFRSHETPDDADHAGIGGVSRQPGSSQLAVKEPQADQGSDGHHRGSP
jgi:hypothetical protein